MPAQLMRLISIFLLIPLNLSLFFVKFSLNDLKSNILAEDILTNACSGSNILM